MRHRAPLAVGPVRRATGPHAQRRRKPLRRAVAAPADRRRRGFLTILALLAIASYNAIAKHLELAAQERALSEERAPRAAQAEPAAGELATLRRQERGRRAQIEQLSAALDQAQAERWKPSRRAARRAPRLRSWKARWSRPRRRARGSRPSSPRRARPVTPAGPRVRAGIRGHAGPARRGHRPAGGARAGEPRGRSVAPHGDPGAAGAGRVPGRRRDLGAAAGTGEDTSGDAATAARAHGPPAADAVRRLQQDLADAQATVATLSADLEALKGTGAGARPPMPLPSWSRSRSRSGARTGGRSSSASPLPGGRHAAAPPRPLPRRLARPVQHPCPRRQRPVDPQRAGYRIST